MDYKYCKRCGKLYNYNGSKICHECVKALDDVVFDIKNYLSENPSANVMNICKNLEIDEKDILYLIREQRIELTQIDLDKVGVVCAKCGKPTLGEKYCRECKEKMSEDLLGATEKIRENIVSTSKKSVGVVNTLMNRDDN